jgi:ABC-type phosphate transport system substrate-binding protein
MKKVLKVAALGASIVALASAASAADLNMNIYGASAQGKFWKAEAKTFLETPFLNGGAGCTGATVVGQAPGNSKLGITVGQNCELAGGDKVFIRYTENKSVEGPRAVMNLDPQEVDNCITGQPTNDGQRSQAHWDGSAFSAQCLDVHVGASDVASESFTQESHGYLNGKYNSTQFDEVLAGQVIPGAADIGRAEQPIIVPFSFFANSKLPVDGINRQQALLLFSGNINNWNQFGSAYVPAGFTNSRVVLCMRHAGSGTHATLDKAIMRGDRLLSSQQSVSNSIVAASPKILFHESSSDLMKCVNENGTYLPTTTIEVAAIGYADTDKPVSSLDASGNEVFSYPNVKRLKYNGGGEGMTPANMTAFGYSGQKNEIINGINEFWSSQWMYIKQGQESETTMGLFDKMMAFASSKVLPCTAANTTGCYWLTKGQLKAKKETDTTVPHF